MSDVATIHDERETLWVTDAELIRRMGVPEKVARDALRALDVMDGRRSGFPQKSKLWGNRRYWPAVRSYFDRQEEIKMAGQPLRRQSQ